MPICPLCGEMCKENFCAHCDAVLEPDEPVRKRVSAQRRVVSRAEQVSAAHEHLTPPPAPKNQPALLLDASPVFTPYIPAEPPVPEIVPETSPTPPEEFTDHTEFLFGEPTQPDVTTDEITASQYGFAVDMVLTPEEASESPVLSEETADTASENESVSQIAESEAEIEFITKSSVPVDAVIAESEIATEEQPIPVTDVDVICEDAPENTAEQADAADETLPQDITDAQDAETAADEATPVDIDSANDEPVFISVDDNIPDDLGDSNAVLQVRLSLDHAITFARCMISGDFSQAAQELMSGPACWQWLIPLHLAGIIFTAIAAWQTLDATLFSRFTTSLGASALVWCEHMIISLLLFCLLTNLAGCRKPFWGIVSAVFAITTPLAVFSIPAMAVSFISGAAAFSFMLFGIMLSALFAYRICQAADILSCRFGKLYCAICLFADILLTALSAAGLIS